MTQSDNKKKKPVGKAKFKEGDLIKMTQTCSGCEIGQTYRLHYGNKEGNHVEKLWAWNEEGPEGGGCSCSILWKKVVEPIEVSGDEEIVVHLGTIKSVEVLKEAYARVGWEWHDGDFWKIHKEETCVRFQEVFAYSFCKFYQGKGCRIIDVTEALRILEGKTSFDGATLGGHAYPILINPYPLTKTNMEDTSLQAKVSRLFKGEPAKSAEKLGFEDSSGELTSSGEEVFIEWLYKKAKNGELAEADFAKDIIYPLRDEDKKEKKKK